MTLATSSTPAATKAPVALIPSEGVLRGIVPETLSQEGITFTELPAVSIDELKTSKFESVQVAIVAADLNAAQRQLLKEWRDAGRSVIVLKCDSWPIEEITEWFGVEAMGEETSGGYFWPNSSEFAIPATPGDQPLQIFGRRRLYKLSNSDSDVQILANGSANPTAAACLDANRDGFCDDEWFWSGGYRISFRRGRTLVTKSRLDGIETPTAAATGDFSGDGFLDGLLVANGNDYARLVENRWIYNKSDHPIRHAMGYRTAGAVWAIDLFLEDGSIFQTSLDGGATFGPIQAFAPGGQAVPTDFGYSFDYLDEQGIVRSGRNVFSQGVFYANFEGAWTELPLVPDLGPKYLLSNIMQPNLGYSSDVRRLGFRSEINLQVHSNVYARDDPTGTFNFPLEFHRLYGVGKLPLVVRKANAVAYLFDCEQTIHQLQQGQWITEAMYEQLLNLLGPSVAFTPIVNAFDNFVDYNNLDLPQADLHERLLRRLVESLLDLPLPRVWYLPNGYRSVVSLSHDVETSSPGVGRPQVRAATMKIADMASKSKRSDTFFMLMTDRNAGTLSEADFAELKTEGHSVTVHFDSFGSTDFTAENLIDQSSTLRSFGVSPITGTRAHGLAWFEDFMAQAVAAQPETIYEATYGGGPGYSHTGSVLPHRVFARDGTAYTGFYEMTNGLMDIADSSFFFDQIVPPNQLTLPLIDLFDRARQMAVDNDRKYYGIFDLSFHPVVVAGMIPPIPEFFDKLEDYVDFLDRQKIPSMNLEDLAQWWNSRSDIALDGIAWKEDAQLEFTIIADGEVEKATFVFQSEFQGRTLSALTAGTTRLDFDIQVLDGDQYAMFVLPKVTSPLNVSAKFS